MAKKKAPLVIIEWEDSCATARWTDAATLEKSEPALVRTAGWLIASNKRAKVVSGSISYDGGVTEGDCTMTIPLGCIRKVRRLKS